MIDHADTIRRFFSECQPVQYHAGAWGPPTEALYALVAERQQAIDERNEWARQAREAETERDYLRAERQQAIDALRRIEHWPYRVTSNAHIDLTEVKDFARAALLSLGERES